jgi:hypothetical protein
MTPHRWRRLSGTAWAVGGLLAAVQAGAFLSGVSVSVSNPVVSQASNYLVQGNVLENAIGVGDLLSVTFPAGTDVSGLSAADILVNAATPTVVGITGTKVTITSPVSLALGQGMAIQFLNLRIINPPSSGATFLTLATPLESGNGFYNLIDPTPTFTVTSTRTGTPTQTRTATPTCTVTPSSTVSPTPTISRTATITQTRTITVSPTISPTITLTATPQSSQTTTQTVTTTPLVLSRNTLLCYPAPARGKEVWFYFNADQAGRLEIELFNVSGEKIKSLGEALPQAGYGHFRWALDKVSPGVYLYRARFLDNGGKGAWGSLQKMAVVK